jgi:DUF2934 family protein
MWCLEDISIGIEEDFRMKGQRTTPTEVESENQTGSAPDIVEQIQVRAHELFEQRGREEGHDLDDWLQAEAEVTQQKAKAKAA